MTDEQPLYRGAKTPKDMTRDQELAWLRKERVRISNELCRVKQVSRAMLDAIENEKVRNEYLSTCAWLHRKTRS